ncbi:MAG: hypothetical protein ACFCVK_09515 [Acidimicrobiales bacterium]
MTTTTMHARDPRLEARAVVGPDLEPAVLEPSPPAVTIGPWFADDPIAGTDPDRPLLLPAGHGATDAPNWTTWLAAHPEHTDWAAERWLAGPRRLPPTPAALVPTRRSLHRLAAYVIAPARHAVTGKFGLRWSLGGFGTPFFGDDRQLRVEGDRLVDQRGGVARSVPITTLRAASEFLGVAVDAETAAEHDTPAVGDIDAPLVVDETASRFLGPWFGMAFAALEAFRADVRSVDPSRPQLWPGHFDPALEEGDEDHRASYGASPGDDGIDEPYLYVSVWWPDRLGVSRDDVPFWDAPSFTGRVLRVSEFPSGDPVEVAASFWAETRDALQEAPGRSDG